jgi:C1A family cysteine protease
VSSSKAPTASPTTNEDITSVLEKIVTVRADYSGYDMSILPAEFEPQKKEWKAWLVDAVDQGSCGSCWSFASVGALSDRFNVLMRKRFLPQMLSPLLPTVCNDVLTIALEDNPEHLETVKNPFRLSATTLENLACHGNSLVTACYYLFSQGTTTDECISYSSRYAVFVNYKISELYWGFPFQNSVYFPRSVGKAIYDYTNFKEDQNKGTCGFYNQSSQRPFAFCNDYIRINSTKNYGSPQQHFQALLMYQIRGVVQDNRQLMMDIFKWGPVCSAFTVYDDFYDFDPKTTAVYVHDPTRTNVVGGHAVEIVGWGLHGTTPFWWVKNSWGPEYGENGYFRFLRGSDQCGLETNVVSMLPNLFFPLDRVSFVEDLEASLQRLDIFTVSYTPWFEDFQIRVAKTFEPNAPFHYPQVTVRSAPFMQQRFPLLQFHALSRIGYLNSDTLSPSGYNSGIYRTMPGLYVGVPFVFFPFTRDFVAGIIPSRAPKNNKFHLGEWTWTLFFLLLMVLLVVIVVVVAVLWTRK